MEDCHPLLDKYADFFPGSFLDGEKEKTLCRYFSILLTKALPHGFIGKETPEGIFAKHILDSVSILNAETIAKVLLDAQSPVDIGTGAGLPGIPLSILTGKKITLLDSSANKIRFLEETVKTLNMESMPARNIFLGDKNRADKASYDVILFRAFRKPAVSLELALHVADADAKVLYWHTDNLEKNADQFSRFLEIISGMGYHDPRYFPLPFPEEYGKRGVYLFEYSKKENSGYPRSVKKIEKDIFYQNFY